MITLNKLLLYKELSELKFLTNNRGINNEVRDITVMEVPEVCNWLHGNELVITSLYAVKDDIEKQVKLIEDLKSVNCSGLLVKLGPYVKKLDKRVIDKAEELEIPILIVPEKVTYVDIIGPVMRIIAKNEEDIITVENALYKLALNTSLKATEISEIERVFGVKSIEELFVFFLVEYSTEDGKYLDKYSSRFYKIRIGDSNIYSFIYRDKSEISYIRDEVYNHLSKLNHNSIFILGNIKKGITNIKENLKDFDRLINEIKLLKDFPKRTYLFKDIEAFIVAEKFVEFVGKDYYDEYLKLLSCEEIETLEIFINNSFNVVKTSEDLFLHKNTIRYRLKSIEDKIGLDPFSFTDSLKIYYGIQYEKKHKK